MQTGKGGEHARRVTPDGYFGPQSDDPERRRHFDETARILATALTGSC